MHSSSDRPEGIIAARQVLKAPLAEVERECVMCLGYRRGPPERARLTTVGHSTRSLEAFIDLLRAAGVDHVADVRSFPRSRSNPDYNIDTLPDRLAERQIGYRHMPALGGRRGRQAGVPEEINAGWRNRSFHNYADYALSADLPRPSPSCATSAALATSRTCAPRRSGGDVTVASSRTT